MQMRITHTRIMNCNAAYFMIIYALNSKNKIMSKEWNIPFSFSGNIDSSNLQLAPFLRNKFTQLKRVTSLFSLSVYDRKPTTFA